MPKLPAVEEKVLRFYIQEGGTEEKIPVVAQRYRMTVAAVTRMLKLKRVRDAFEVRMAPVRMEQEKQKLLADAVAVATAKAEAEKAEAEKKLNDVLNLPRIPVQGNELVIEQELMRLVQLCPEKYGGIKLAAIKTAFVVAGLMEQGTTRRVIPAEGKGEVTGGGVYQNLFDRQRQLEAGIPPAAIEGQTAPATPPPQTDDQIFDLTPVKAKAPEPPLLRIPPPGEGIEQVLPAKKKTSAQVITVEVGG
jgi:hypothetical protein